MRLANYLVFEACSNTALETLTGKIFYWKIAGNFIINYFVIIIIFFLSGGDFDAYVWTFLFCFVLSSHGLKNCSLRNS